MNLLSHVLERRLCLFVFRGNLSILTLLAVGLVAFLACHCSNSHVVGTFQRALMQV